MASSAPSGPGWLHELKHDGFRLLAWKDGERVRLWTRQANDFTDHFKRIAEAVAALPIQSGLLDGEAVLFRPDGHSDFDGLRSKDKAAEAVMVGFDLIQVDGRDLRKAQLEYRRGELERLLAGKPDGLLFSQAIPGDGPTIFEHACRLGAEGIVSKRLGSAYRSGRTGHWLKIKNRDFKRL